MSVKQLAALARRHVLAVLLILLATIGIAIDLGCTPSSYAETAVVAVEPESFRNLEPLNNDQVFLRNSSLITTCQVLIMELSSPRGELQLHDAGVVGKFSMSIVNSENLYHPIYDYPELLVSVTDMNPDTTHRQWVEARQVIATDIAAFQVGDHIADDDLIMEYPLSDSGPISQSGSLTRTYAALAVLAVVAMFCICRFLDSRSRAWTRMVRP